MSHEGPEVMQAFVDRHRAFFILLGVLLAQLLLLSFQITRNHNVRLIQAWTVAIFDPFERALHWTVDRTTRTWRNYRGLLHAQQENRELRSQLEEARAQVQQLSEKAAEAERLRALLELKSQLPGQAVASEVIATSPGERSNAIFINKGADAGLTSDLAVVTPAGIVGKTIAVFPHTAQVQLITDPSSGVGCYLEKTRVQGVLRGHSRDLVELHYVMDEQPVEINERVLSSGLDQVYPKGLPVGTVVKTSGGTIYKNILVKPSAELDQLETVLVLLKPASTEPQALNLPPRP